MHSAARRAIALNRLTLSKLPLTWCSEADQANGHLLSVGRFTEYFSYVSGFPVCQRISGELHHVILRFDRARSGRPVGSKIVSGGARSGNFRVDFSGSRVFPDHVARSILK